jgi:hypothetical protein
VQAALSAVRYFNKRFLGHMTVDAKFSTNLEQYLLTNQLLSEQEAQFLRSTANSGNNQQLDQPMAHMQSMTNPVYRNPSQYNHISAANKNMNVNHHQSMYHNQNASSFASSSVSSFSAQRFVSSARPTANVHHSINTMTNTAPYTHNIAPGMTSNSNISSSFVSEFYSPHHSAVNHSRHTMTNSSSNNNLGYGLSSATSSTASSVASSSSSQFSYHNQQQPTHGHSHGHQQACHIHNQQQQQQPLQHQQHQTHYHQQQQPPYQQQYRQFIFRNF